MDYSVIKKHQLLVKNIEMIAPSRVIWINGARKTAKQFGEFIIDHIFNKSDFARLQNTKFWLYDSMLRVVNVYCEWRPQHVEVRVLMKREDNRLVGFIFKCYYDVEREDIDVSFFKGKRDVDNAIKFYHDLFEPQHRFARAFAVTHNAEYTAGFELLSELINRIEFTNGVNNEFWRETILTMIVYTDYFSKGQNLGTAGSVQPFKYEPDDAIHRYDVVLHAPEVKKFVSIVNKYQQAKEKMEKDRAEYQAKRSNSHDNYVSRWYDDNMPGKSD